MTNLETTVRNLLPCIYDFRQLYISFFLLHSHKIWELKTPTVYYHFKPGLVGAFPRGCWIVQYVLE